MTPVLASGFARALALKSTAPTSDFWVIGSDTVAGFSEIVVARFDSAGAVVAQQNLGSAFFGTPGFDYYGLDIVFDPASGYLYLAGIVKDPAGPSKHMIVVKIDGGLTPVAGFGGTSATVPHAGVVTVQVTVGGTPRNSEARGVAIGNNGGIYVAGLVELGPVTQIAAVRLKPSNGSLVAENTIGPPDSIGQELLMDSRNRVVIVGQAPGAPPQTPQ